MTPTRRALASALLGVIAAAVISACSAPGPPVPVASPVPLPAPVLAPPVLPPVVTPPTTTTAPTTTTTTRRSRTTTTTAAADDVISDRCTNQIDYAEDPRSNAEINSIGAETGECPEPITASEFEDVGEAALDACTVAIQPPLAVAGA